MYLQHFVKGIAGKVSGQQGGVLRGEAFDLVLSETGIISNWWRKLGTVTPAQRAAVLTPANLDRHLHDYDNFGADTPYISLACGCVERDVHMETNKIHSAVDTALIFATDYWARPGALYFGWTIVGLNCAAEIEEVSEAVRELNLYRRWSPYQLEGEVTAKISIPSNHIERIEWWDGSIDRGNPVEARDNPKYVKPVVLGNIKDIF